MPNTLTGNSPSARDAVAFCDNFNSNLKLSNEELAHKRQLMTSTPLRLARCMPALMMSDLLGPWLDQGTLSTQPAPVVWISADAHIGNFGLVLGDFDAPVWGLNDYDMSCRGSPAMDLNRLAFSLVSTIDTLQSKADPGEVVDTLVSAYRKGLQALAGGKDLGCAGLTADEASGEVLALIKGAETSQKKFIKGRAEQAGGGQWKFIAKKNTETIATELKAKLVAALGHYDGTQGRMSRVARPLDVLDVDSKQESGGSSHGQPRYLALVRAADKGDPPVLLEVKQELPAPLTGWTGDNPREAAELSRRLWTGDLYLAGARQVVTGQAAMGGAHNPLTGFTWLDDISYLVREREACKATLTDQQLNGKAELKSFAGQAGTVLARSHARNPHLGRDILAWVDAQGEASFARRLRTFAQAYAQQAAEDVKAYRAAYPEDWDRQRAIDKASAA